MNTNEKKYTIMYKTPNLPSSDLFEELSDIQLETVIGGQDSGSLISGPIINGPLISGPILGGLLIDNSNGGQIQLLGNGQASAQQHR